MRTADLERESRRILLYSLLSPWRRRGASLLQVGLQSGLMPDFFWEAGFDVSALDAEPAAVEAAAALTGPRVEYSLGQPDFMPFEDGAFDHVVLAHMDLRSREILAEALRVASRGVIVLEWNRFALAGPGRQGEGSWPWSLVWLARKACPDCRVSLRSIMPWAWRKPAHAAEAENEPENAAGSASILPTSQIGSMERDLPGEGQDKAEKKNRLAAMQHRHRGGFGRQINTLVMPLPLGALMGLRMEKSPLILTPIGPVTESPPARAYAAQPVVNRVGRSGRELLPPPKSRPHRG